MKFSVSRDDLQHGIAAAQRATATRVIQPILANLLMELEVNTLKLSATDLDLAIETVVTVTTDIPGKTTVSAKKLSEIISKLPSGSTIQFEIDPKTQVARIQCEASVFDIRTLSAEEYPLIKQIDQEQYLELNLRSLVRAINQTYFAAASYETNNVLGGVYFKLTPESLELAATDGSRLARTIETTAAQNVTDPISAIIPVKTLQEFTRLVGSPKEEGTVRIAIQEGQISFRTEAFYVLSRLLDGQYPQYQQLIPVENKFVAHTNRKALIDSLERTAVMANERTNVVKLTFDNDHLSLAANTPDLGDSQDSIAARYDGSEPLNIAFNYKFLLDALKVIESDDVRMETNGALSPTLFRSEVEDSGYLCLVMPVQVK